jgi:hypothetical protein
MKKRIFFFILSLIIIMFSGCKKNPTESVKIDAYRLKKIFYSPDNYTEYFYNENLLIQKVLVTSDSTSDKFDLIYDTNGKLMKREETSTNTGTSSYSYTNYKYNSNNLLIKSNTYLKKEIGSYELSSYITYEYTNGNLVKYFHYNSKNSIISTNNFSYDDNGNITSETMYDSTNTLKLTAQYEYDNKLNPLKKDLSIISAARISNNNIIKSSTLNYNTWPPGNFSTTNTYTYNEGGYPIECTSENKITWKGVTSTYTTGYIFEYY